MIRNASPVLQRECEQCGAAVTTDTSCSERFDLLLALDHSRTEPWGSRHGLAFAAFTLQHSRDASAPAVQRCLEMLHRVYVLGEDRAFVASTLRRPESSGDLKITYPEEAPNTFAVTIDDLGDFAADSYAAMLDAWCPATLDAWSR